MGSAEESVHKNRNLKRTIKGKQQQGMKRGEMSRVVRLMLLLETSSGGLCLVFQDLDSHAYTKKTDSS